MIGFLFFTFNHISGFIEAAMIKHFFMGQPQSTSQAYAAILTGSATGPGEYFPNGNGDPVNKNSFEMSASTNPGYQRQLIHWSEPDDNGYMYNTNTLIFSATSNHSDIIECICAFDNQIERTGNVLLEAIMDEDWGLNGLLYAGPLSSSTNYEINSGDLVVGYANTEGGRWAAPFLPSAYPTPYLLKRTFNHFYRTGSLPAANGKYLGLFTTSPSWPKNNWAFGGESLSDTYTQGIEVSAADYERQAINWVLNQTTIDDFGSYQLNWIENDNTIIWRPRSNWGEIQGFGIWDAPTDGNLLVFTRYAADGSSQVAGEYTRTINKGQEIRLASGTLGIYPG